MRLRAATALCALLAACGPGAGDAGTAAGDAAAGDTASPAASEVPQSAEEFLAVQADQAREDSAEYAERVGSMATYAQCMQQLRGLDSAVAAPLRVACGRLRDAPR
jgi:hypothetical protein